MTKAITRVQLYDAVHRKVGLSRVESAKLTESVLKEITNALERGDSVKLSGFGAFTIRKKNQRLGRNPKTGVEVAIAPRTVIVFKASNIMKRQVNSPTPLGERASTTSE